MKRYKRLGPSAKGRIREAQSPGTPEQELSLQASLKLVLQTYNRGFARDQTNLAHSYHDASQRLQTWWLKDGCHIPGRFRDRYDRSDHKVRLTHLDRGIQDAVRECSAALARTSAPASRWLDLHIPQLNQRLYQVELDAHQQLHEMHARENFSVALSHGKQRVATRLAEERRSPRWSPARWRQVLKAGAVHGTRSICTFSARAIRVLVGWAGWTKTAIGNRLGSISFDDPLQKELVEPPQEDPVEVIYRLNRARGARSEEETDDIYRFPAARRSPARRILALGVVVGAGLITVGMVAGGIR